MEAETPSGSSGALFGSIVIIAILLIGGIYIFYTRLEDAKNKQNLDQNQAQEKMIK